MQLVEEIQGLAPQCRFLVLALTGKDLAPTAWDGVRVIGKPFDLNEVVRVVESVVRAPTAHDV